MAAVCKFRHVYGQAAKPADQFLELPRPLTSGEGSYVKASHKYMAFSSTSVRRLYIRKLDQTGRFRANESHIGPDCLKGKIWDFDFHPFCDNLIAMGDDNGKVAVVTIPDSCNELGYLTENVSKASVDLGTAHSKKVVLLSFHPCANNILATGSFDRSVKIWDISNNAQGKCLTTIDGFEDTIYSMEWNLFGSLIGASSKDKTIRVCDPRNTGSTTVVIEKAFDGIKSSKVFWLSNKQCIGSTGFSKTARRQIKLWDLRNIAKPLIAQTIDQASSILMPRYDEGNNLLYMAGKGDGTVSYGEFRNDNSLFHTLGTYRSPEPQRGGGWVPKRGLNVWKCEIERFLKLTRKSIIPVSFIVPRKAGSDIFQADIYPDSMSGMPAMTAHEWFDGKQDKNAVLMSLDPEHRDDKKEQEQQSKLQKQQQINPSPRTTKEETSCDESKQDDKTTETTVTKNNSNSEMDPLSEEKEEDSNSGQKNASEVFNGQVKSKSRHRTQESVMVRPAELTDTITNAALEDEVKVLKTENATIKNENIELKKENAELKDTIKQLKLDLAKSIEKAKEDDSKETETETESSKEKELANNTTEDKVEDKTETGNEKQEKSPVFAEKSIWEDDDDE